MTERHFAVLCPEASGHALPMSALTTELSSRGHRITYITTADGVDRCRASGVDARQVGAEQFPRGVNQRLFAELGNLTGVAAATYVLRIYEQGVQMMLDEAPGQIRDCGADVILADETWWVARTLGQQLELPYLSVCNALPFHPDALHPSMFSSAGYGTGWAARIRNLASDLPVTFLMGRMRRMIMRRRRELGLPSYRFREGNASRLATFVTDPRSLRFPPEQTRAMAPLRRRIAFG